MRTLTTPQPPRLLRHIVSHTFGAQLPPPHTNICDLPLDLLLPFCSTYGRISYRFPPVFSVPVGGDSIGISQRCLVLKNYVREKLEPYAFHDKIVKCQPTETKLAGIMLNNLSTVQKFVWKFWKLMELFIVKFWYFQQCTCIILTVNTLCYNDVILNQIVVFSTEDKILIKALWHEKSYWARKLIAEFSNKMWSSSGFSYTPKIKATGSVERKQGSRTKHTVSTSSVTGCQTGKFGRRWSVCESSRETNQDNQNWKLWFSVWKILQFKNSVNFYRAFTDIEILSVCCSSVYLSVTFRYCIETA